MSLVISQRESIYARKETLGIPQTQIDPKFNSIKGFFTNLQKKLDGVSQRLNGHILDVGIVREIEKKSNRSEIMGSLKYNLTAEVDSSGTPK